MYAGALKTIGFATCTRAVSVEQHEFALFSCLCGLCE